MYNILVYDITTFLISTKGMKGSCERVKTGVIEKQKKEGRGRARESRQENRRTYWKKMGFCVFSKLF